jgi:hypothetical protein
VLVDVLVDLLIDVLLGAINSEPTFLMAAVFFGFLILD